MSVVNVKRIAKTRSAVDYELYGALYSEKYRKHKATNTDRVAAMTCDCASAEEFVELAEALAAKHGRKIEARSLIQSFENTEFDPNDPEQVREVNELGYELAKRLHPNSYALVITHTDGHGGHPHNHIKVLNHDNRTGKALRGYDLHYMVAKVNDELMRERDLRVAVRGSRSKDQRSYWELDRDGTGVTEFEQALGDRIKDALDDEHTVDEASFREALIKRSIELREDKRTIKASADGKTPEHESIGWTYAMRDETGEKPRMRRRKASSLSDEFTYKSVHQLLEEKQLQAQRAAARVTGNTPVTQITPVTPAAQPADPVLAELEAGLARVRAEGSARADALLQKRKQDSAAEYRQQPEQQDDATTTSAAATVVADEQQDLEQDLNTATSAPAPVAAHEHEHEHEHESTASAPAVETQSKQEHEAERHEESTVASAVAEPAMPSAPASVTPAYRSRMRDVPAGNDEQRDAFQALAELDEDYQREFADGREPDAAFERRATALRIGEHGLHNFGHRLDDRVRDALQQRIDARARATQAFEDAKSASAKNQPWEFVKVARMRDQIADGNYTETPRLLEVEQRQNEIARRGPQAVEKAVANEKKRAVEVAAAAAAGKPAPMSARAKAQKDLEDRLEATREKYRSHGLSL